MRWRYYSIVYYVSWLLLHVSTFCNEFAHTNRGDIPPWARHAVLPHSCKPKVHYFDLLLTCWTTSRATSWNNLKMWICCWLSIFVDLLYDMLWMCCTACCTAWCTTNPEQIEVSGAWAIRWQATITRWRATICTIVYTQYVTVRIRLEYCSGANNSAYYWRCAVQG